MKKSGFSSWNNIFAFTFKQHAGTKSWLLMTLIVALLLFIGISAGMLIYEVYQKTKEVITETKITDVYVVDDTEGGASYAYLNLLGDQVYNKINYITAGSAEEAVKGVEKSRTSLILDVKYNMKTYDISVVRPDKTDISKKDAKTFRDFISYRFVYILIQKSGIKLDELSELNIPIITSVMTGGETKDEDLSNVKQMINVIMPYISILLIYLLVLIYGQSVAASAITEKTSKLMDFFLISVRPSSMMLGKVLAIALAGLLQLTVWIAGIAGGFAVGAALVRAYNPGTNMGLLKLFAVLGDASGLFSAGSIIMAAAVTIAGFLLYCSIAAIGGSLASKAEDLPTTNVFFTLILVISFFTAMYGGGFSSGMVSRAEWLVYIPFTSVLVTPTRLLLGEINMVQGLISLILIVILMLIGVIFAGKVYTLTTFWQGKPPTIGTMIELMKKKKGQA